MLKQIEKEIELEVFSAEKYTSRTNREKYKLSKIIDQYLEFSHKRLKDPEDRISYATYVVKKGIANNYLRPHFGHLDIQFIPKNEIRNIFRDKVDKRRRKVFEELSALFNFVEKELDLAFSIPPMPKRPKKNLKDESKLPDVKVLWEVIPHMKNKYAQAVAALMGVYLLRPSDILTLKTCDLNTRKNELQINRHLSYRSIEDGRKSSNLLKDGPVTHTLPLDYFFEILKQFEIAIPIEADAFIFPGKFGPHLSYDAFKVRWREGAIDAGFFERVKDPKSGKEKKKASVQAYEAAKHAGVSKLLEEGASPEMIIRVAGISRDMLKHYARIRASQTRGTIELLQKNRT